MSLDMIKKAEDLLGVELHNFIFNGKFHRFGKKKEIWIIGNEVNYLNNTINFINCGNYSNGTSFKLNSFGNVPHMSWPKKLKDAQAIAESKIR